MLRSLFTGITGLRSHQTMMDVTGNNIANVNTTGFKSSQTLFQDTLSQTLKGATAPLANAGGSNPSQVGLGVQVAGIGTNLTQGAAQATGRTTDLSLNGDGYFVVQAANGEQLYTRAGAFELDATGRLVSQPRELVMGWAAVAGTVDTTGAVGPLTIPVQQLTSYSIGADGVITGNFTDGRIEPIGQVAVASFVNPAGLEKAGGLLMRPSPNSGAVEIGAAGTGARGSISSGRLEMSNVDLAAEFTNLIIAQRGFQANSRVITSSDELLQDLVNLKR